MFPTLEPQLARYRELEQQLYDPAISADPAKAGAIGKERGALAKSVEPYIEYKHALRRHRGRGGDGRRCGPGSDGRGGTRGPAPEARRPPREDRRPAPDRPVGRLLEDHRRDPRRRGRRRGRALRGRPVRNVHALRPHEGLEHRGHLGQPRRRGRLQGNHLRRGRTGRLPVPPVRVRRPPRAARPGDGDAGADSHLAGDRRG